MADILVRLRHMEKTQGEDYVWRTAKDAADEIDRLRALLDGRDKFIVGLGQWQNFVDQLPK